MRPITTIRGRSVPLDRTDVDTDQIIPAHWLKRVERHGFGEGLFERWRGSPDLHLDDPERAGATILLAGANFGIGSSREHAVWALQDRGFQAVVSARFGDIFRTNALRSGLVPVQVEESAARRLLDASLADPSLELLVDIERRSVGAASLGLEWSFRLDDRSRQRLLEGLDDIGTTLRQEEAIAAYEGRRPPWMPSLTA